MFRYVAVIRSDALPGQGQQATIALRRRLQGWTTVIDNPWVTAWITRRAPSQLMASAAPPDSCVLGKTFPRAPRAADFQSAAAGTGPLGGGLWGPYVTVRTDRARGETEVARDPSGRIECWRFAVDGADIVFSHYPDVCWLRAHPAMIDEDVVAYALAASWMHGAHTALVGVSELLPGCVRTYAIGRATTERMWWRPDEVASQGYEEPEAAARDIRDAAERVVSAWAGGYGAIALDLSGGLDSAIVLGLLNADRGDRRLVALNYATAHAEGDERAYAEAAALRHGVELISREAVQPGQGPEVSWAGRLLRPSGRVLSAPTEHAYMAHTRAARADAFFSGTGGDHLFGKGVRGEAFADFIGDHGLGARALETAHDLARLSRTTIWSVFAEAARARAPVDACIDQALSPNPFVDAEVRAAIDHRRHLHPWVLQGAEAVRPSKRKQALSFFELDRHHARWGRADVAEEVHPLISQPLMEACLRTPCYWLSGGGVQRSLVRSAFADLLPQSIRERRSKGATTSHWLRMIADDLPRTRERLLEGRLTRLGLLDRARVERALRPLDLAKEKAFPSLLICLATEIWLEQAASDPAAGGP